jgi:hypothetical protein
MARTFTVKVFNYHPNHKIDATIFRLELENLCENFNLFYSEVEIPLISNLGNFTFGDIIWPGVLKISVNRKEEENSADITITISANEREFPILPYGITDEIIQNSVKLISLGLQKMKDENIIESFSINPSPPRFSVKQDICSIIVIFFLFFTSFFTN